MSPHHSAKVAEDVRLPVMDNVNPEDIDRLDARVEEPDDQVFHQLDMNSRSNGERRDHSLLHHGLDGLLHRLVRVEVRPIAERVVKGDDEVLRARRHVPVRG